MVEDFADEVFPLHIGLTGEGASDIAIDHLNEELPHFKRSANGFPTRR